MLETKKRYERKVIFLSLLLLLQTWSIAVFAQNTVSIKMNVDATEASRSLLHTSLTIPVKPGPLTLFYPKWIPGEHSPTGPINDMVGLRVSARGKQIPWRRDDIEMFAFHCDIPSGVNVIEVAFDDVSQPGTTSTAQLARIKWNRLLVYPRGISSDAVRVQASLKLPAGWKYGTALSAAREMKNDLEFKEVSLTELVDSPAVIGAHFRKVALTSGGTLHEMDIAADSPAALEIKPQTLVGFQNLVKEAPALFGARHYRSYRFLLTLSDYGGSEGLEHHESSEDGVGEKALSDPGQLLDLGDLLGHEYAHSWNGKYRRPADLTTPDFEQPMKGDLLWVYEGLTEYLGKVLPTRSGLWTPENFRQSIAAVAAEMDNQSGRKWRPLVDTATAVQITYSSPRAWMNYRRRVDYYFEGLLLWMEADVLIRSHSQGKLSLDDFLHKFHGGQDSPPIVRTYTFDDIVATLNEVMPYDWREFLNERVNMVAPRAPLGGITNGGWKLVYNETSNEEIKFNEQQKKFRDFTYSVGFIVKDDGTLLDVSPEKPAGKAGLAPGMKVISINGRGWSSDALHDAIAATKTNAAPLEFLVENGSFQQTYKVDYRGGERYPHLERDPTKPDLLSEIIKPHAH
ncbi:MAG TPA: peptidase M61 [Blastocatellia bacterium]|nr:peptidase M61 [Blastocatellia bacterium]